MALGGVVFAEDKQDLRQSFQVAKDFFAKVKPGAIKFVLIGLSPTQAVEENVLGDYFKLCLDNKAKPVAVVLPVKAEVRKTYNADVVKTFRDTINTVVKNYKATFLDLLDVRFYDSRFQENLHFNSDGAAIVSALIGARLYNKRIITSVASILNMDSDFFNLLSRHFPDDHKNMIHHVFCRVACDDFNRLSKIFPRKICINLMAHTFAEMTYNHLAILSDMLSKDAYNYLAACVFKISADKIRCKDKIKIGFALRRADEWC